MAQLSLYINDEISRRLDEVAAAEGISRSALARRALEKELGARRRFPESFFAVMGPWEDDRSANEILRDIRANTWQREREPLS